MLVRNLNHTATKLITSDIHLHQPPLLLGFQEIFGQKFVILGDLGGRSSWEFLDIFDNWEKDRGLKRRKKKREKKIENLEESQHQF